MPYDSSCWIVWDKKRDAQDFADCELAWTSFKSAVKIFRFAWDGFRQEDMKNKEKRVHPNQKPIRLYEWLLTNYADKNDGPVLDSHVGSGNSLIACRNLGFDYMGFEIDEYYYNVALERIDEYSRQQRLF